MKETFMEGVKDICLAVHDFQVALYKDSRQRTFYVHT